MITLESDDWRLWIAPEVGASWMACEIRRGADWLPLMPDCRAANAPLSAASFCLAPYSNRIRDGRFTYADEVVQLDDAQGHAIHGAVRKLPWQVVSSSPSAAVCQIDSREHASFNWPWPMLTTLETRLDADTLTSTLSIENLSSRAMPAGLGWHPYFTRTIDGASPRLSLPVTGVFPDATGDGLPDGAPVDLPGDFDYREPRVIDPAVHVDHCMSGFSGKVRIAWPDAGFAIDMQTSDLCRFAILYHPTGEAYFALEPVSNANDAFNLDARGVDAGLLDLAPGESVSATLTLRLDQSG